MRSICCGVNACRSARRVRTTSSEPELEQDPVQLLVVVDVLLALLALDPVERRLGDVDVAQVEQPPHLAVQEREEKRPDVGAVHVGIRHDDDLVVAGLLHVEGALALGVADARADGRDEGADLLVREYLVEARLLGVDELAAQGQDRLVAPVAALLRGAAGRVALDDVELAESRVALGAVGELAREAPAGKRALADRLPGLPRGLAGARRVERLLDDPLGDPPCWTRGRTSASRRRPSARSRPPRSWRAWSWSGPRSGAPAPSPK